jgi:AbrB family looped-hinge helix DNA binding protein
MTTVTVSPKFQIVIPKDLREKLKLRPGQKLFIYEREGNLRLEFPRPISELLGMAKGLVEPWDHEKDRDHSERL